MKKYGRGGSFIVRFYLASPLSSDYSPLFKKEGRRRRKKKKKKIVPKVDRMKKLSNE